MAKYVVDSYAWVEYFRGSKKGETAKSVIDDSKNEKITPLIVLSEITSLMLRQDMDADAAMKVIFSLSSIEELKTESFAEAGMVHAGMQGTAKEFSLKDSFVLLCAKKNGAKILTGNPRFRGVKEAMML